MIVVGNLVGNIAYLGLERSALIVEEALAEVTQQARILRRTMFKDAFARLVHQVKSVEGAVALFKQIDCAQGLQIVLEAAVGLHAFIERILPGMTKRRMPEIMGQGHSLGKVVIEVQGTRNGPPDLCHLDAMRQTGTEQVAFVVYENLGLVFEAAKSGRVDDAITVTLELAA